MSIKAVPKVGDLFDTPFESGCVVAGEPDVVGNFDALDSDGVLVSCSPAMVERIYSLDELRTEAVELALRFVRSSGKTAMRDAGGNASSVADLVAWSLLSGSESVQQEIDRFAEASDRVGRARLNSKGGRS